jgi:hypothetical protein
VLIDIVERERETQAARVLAGPGVTWGWRNNGHLAFMKSQKASTETLETHGFSSNVRNAIMLMTLVVGELFQT